MRKPFWTPKQLTAFRRHQAKKAKKLDGAEPPPPPLGPLPVRVRIHLPPGSEAPGHLPPPVLTGEEPFYVYRNRSS
jgi:hypothetical protein